MPSTTHPVYAAPLVFCYTPGQAWSDSPAPRSVIFALLQEPPRALPPCVNVDPSHPAGGVPA